MIPKSPDRLVLDTNVCLDLFVYRDLRWQPLLQSMENGEVVCVTRADCRTEWILVLEYPRFALSDSARQAAMDAFDRLIIPAEHDLPAELRLPVCKDQDDQKFIELAASSGASHLLSKDKALLKLAGRARRLGLFEIISPAQWVARYALDTSAVSTTSHA